MYEAHFGLRELPFSLTPNTDYLVGLTSHQECLTLVRVALAQGEGFVKVTGEVGTGKTLLCRELLATLDESQYQLAYVPNPDLTPAALHRILAQELHLKVPSGTPSHELLEQINQRLIEIAQQGRSTVLLIDEAQALSREALEAVRLLTNLETTRKKLLQVVLFGQPELDETLDSHDLRQLRQRITFSYRLQPMDEAQTRRYVMHRLSMAGYKGEDLLDGLSYRLLARGTRGIPRLVNITCHKAMMVAYGRGERQIHWRHIRRALADNGRDGGSPLLAWLQHRRRWLGAGAAAIALAFAASAYVQRLEPRPATAVRNPAPSQTPALAPASARIAAPAKMPPPPKATPDTTVAAPAKAAPPVKAVPDTAIAAPAAPARAAAPAPLTPPSPAKGVFRPASAAPAAESAAASTPTREQPTAPKAAETSTEPAAKAAAVGTAATAAASTPASPPARPAAAPGAGTAPAARTASSKPAAGSSPASAGTRKPAAGAQPAARIQPAQAATPSASAGRTATSAKAAAAPAAAKATAPTASSVRPGGAPKAAAAPAKVERAATATRPPPSARTSAGAPARPVATRAAATAPGAARGPQPPTTRSKARPTPPAPVAAPSALMSTADAERARAAAATRTAAPAKTAPAAQAPAAAPNKAP